MATHTYWRKGRLQYSSDGYNTSYRTCPACGCEIDTRAITRHLNAHVRKGEVAKHEYNGQTVYVKG